MEIKIDIPLEPQGKKAPEARIARSRAGQQFIVFYTTKQTRDYEAAVKAHAALVARKLNRPMEGPVSAAIDVTFPIPKSWSNVKWQRAASGLIRPTVKPDADNISKVVGDAFNEVVWGDDAQVVDLHVRKFYGATPGMTATVREVDAGMLESGRCHCCGQILRAA